MEYILRTNTVSKKYTNYYAVDKVSISIQKGEIYGLEKMVLVSLL